MAEASASRDSSDWYAAVHALLTTIGVDAKLMTRDEFDTFMCSDGVVLRL
jgi:hypothetical protein